MTLPLLVTIIISPLVSQTYYTLRDESSKGHYIIVQKDLRPGSMNAFKMVHLPRTYLFGSGGQRIVSHHPPPRVLPSMYTDRGE